MEAQRDDVKVNGARETWEQLQRTQAEVSQLWTTLFTEVARQAGLPPPMNNAGLALYGDRQHAAALAQRLGELLGVEAAQFTVRGSGSRVSHFCVSLNRI